MIKEFIEKVKNVNEEEGENMSFCIDIDMEKDSYYFEINNGVEFIEKENIEEIQKTIENTVMEKVFKMACKIMEQDSDFNFIIRWDFWSKWQINFNYIPSKIYDNDIIEKLELDFEIIGSSNKKDFYIAVEEFEKEFKNFIKKYEIKYIKI